MNFLKKNKTILLFTLLGYFLILLVFSCQKSKPNSFNDFFYPINEWKEGMVYEYRPLGNSELPTEYWYIRKLNQDSSIYLTGQYFDHTFTPRQIFNGIMETHSLRIKDYILYDYDSLGNVIPSPAEIISPHSFPFGNLDSANVFSLQLKWQNPTEEYPDGYIEITRDRQLVGITEYSFKNKSYNCVEFEMKEVVDDFNDGHLEKKFRTKELYAEDLGLIYYRKEIGENFVLEYELSDTFSMKRFEKKFSKYLSEDN